LARFCSRTIELPFTGARLNQDTIDQHGMIGKIR
jgi:hypothetical protein